MNYKSSSSAWTGRAPRTVSERWPEHPRTVRPGLWWRLLIWITGH
jgi:hypothetical protein